MAGFHIETDEMRALASRLMEVSDSLDDQVFPTNPGVGVLATPALVHAFNDLRANGQERVSGLARWVFATSVSVIDTRRQTEQRDDEWALAFFWDKNAYQTGDY